MNRRQALIGGALTAAASIDPAAATAVSGKRADGTLFKSINFAADGLGLDSREYTALLAELTAVSQIREDVYSIGGIVEELEHTFAKLLGKQTAVFLPTGTLANHLAVRTLAGGDRRILVQAESHLYNDSGDCAQTLSGLNLVPLAPDKASFDLADVKRWVESSTNGRVPMRVGAISIENPVRRKNHEMFDAAELERICRYARDQGIRLHLDGARLFTVPYHSGKSLRECAAPFDTVYVSAWKHFNGASGAIVAGDAKYVEGLAGTRRMFGGSLPKAWPEIAPVMKFVESYQDTYARAWEVADAFLARLQADRRFHVEKVRNGTSRFFLEIVGVSPDLLSERLRMKGVILPRPQQATGKFPMQVNGTLTRTTPAALVQMFTDSVKG